jgi:hypothetical protein
MHIERREIIFRVIEIASTVIAIYLYKHFAHDDYSLAIEAILIPLSVILLCESLHMHFIAAPEQALRTKHEINVLRGELEKHLTTQQREAQMRYGLEKVRQQLEKVAECLSSSDIGPRLMMRVVGRAHAEVSAAEIDNIWNQLTWSLSKSYVATNYVNYMHMYGNTRAYAILATQRAKILAGTVTVAKVFIVADDRELSSHDARQTLQMHRSEGITNLTYVYKANIRVRLGDKFAIADKDMDFAIFDDTVVLCWYFDEHRNIKTGRVFFGENEVKPFRDSFAALKSIAAPCPA